MVALSQVVKAKPAWVVGAWFKVAEANAVFDFEGVEGFEPIGGQSNTFQGGFDGNGVTIKNLKMNGGRLIGLIGYVLGRDTRLEASPSTRAAHSLERANLSVALLVQVAI